MPEFCTANLEGHILTVTINRPDRMNSLHGPAHFELAEVLDAFEANPEQWVAILTGAGERAFCAGYDLKWLAEGGSRDRPEAGFGGITSRFDRTKPILAAVNGVALGGGFEIALACDIIVAAENAVFALPEPLVGMVAGAGGLHRLPRQIPLKQAMGMILTGRRLSAHQAYDLGIVTEVVPEGEALAVAKRWAADIEKCSPLSVQASMECVMQGLDYGSVEEAMNADYPSVQKMRQSEDYTEGPRAFAEKRSPQWKGR